MNMTVKKGDLLYIPNIYPKTGLPAAPEDAANETIEMYEVAQENANFTPDKYYDELNFIFQSTGAGGFSNQLQTFLTCLDRYNRNVLPVNREYSGLTFITRPKLNLSSSSLRQSSKMAALDTNEVTDAAHMIRCLLDTKYCRSSESKASSSPLLDIKNPFNIPLCNGITSISGFPDIILETNTTEGGYYSEDQTFIIGSDGLRKTYDLSLTFKDPQGGVLCSIFEYWLEYIMNVTLGTQIAYKEDIDARRLNYTVSIYRFLLDPSKRYVTKYAKATGCYPVSLPIGAMFNVNESEIAIKASGTFTVPFKANAIEYDDPEILVDFRTLIKRYCSSINEHRVLKHGAINNFRGIPWIETTEQGIELQYRESPTNDTYLYEEPKPSLWRG